MSYFTYYGKLKDELFVAVLPNGIVEADDPVYIYSDKKPMSYYVRNSSITQDGDDQFNFNDGFYDFKGVATKAYQELSLTRRTISSGATVTVALTRQYSQPQTSTSASNSPKMWTGTFNFHDWAKNEPVVLVAPKGLGNEKPIVAIWQWTKDQHGTPDALRYSTEKQVSQASSANKFSFKQGGYYDVTCDVTLAGKGLAVIVADGNGPGKEANLDSLPQNTINAEHRFNPPRSVSEKKTLDCMRPAAKPSLPRVTEHLPIPNDLLDKLAYASAFLDEAGYHVKWSQKQFDKLDRAYHLLEEKAEKRAAKIVTLEGDVAKLKAENQGMKTEKAALNKQILDEREKASKREADLQRELQKVLGALQASQGREKKLQEDKTALEGDNKALRDYINKDAAMDKERLRKWEEWKKEEAKRDAERERKWQEHDKADHEAFKRVQEALEKSEAKRRLLSDELAAKQKEILDMQCMLDTARGELKAARGEIDRLKLALAAETAKNTALQQQLEKAQEEIRRKEKDVQWLTQQLNIRNEELVNEKMDKVKIQAKLDVAVHDLEEAKKDIADLKTKIDEQDVELDNRDKWIVSLRAQLKKAEEAAEETEKAQLVEERKHQEVREAYNATKKARDDLMDENIGLRNSQKQKIDDLNKKIEELKARDKTDTHTTVTEILPTVSP
ncbi:hypothetical protein EK21DRAFT_65447 [Setomelanomma holmii]|uniref:Uncharacterized protein n=1 Tax=Setomelanomma holmii TaxID=210430 RepID=A0A9P4H9S6_9PLEO|nr:hypothetical protein EK21DRAFT_65447 [Setomelanomma holmii]